MTKLGAAVLGVVVGGIAVYAVVHRAEATSIASAESTTQVERAELAARHGNGASKQTPRAVANRARRDAPAATSLAFRDLVEPTPRALKTTARARELAGQRVRMTGFMAEMEFAPKGAFYLTPVPVHGDEGGGGTADLPPVSVLVVVPSEKGRSIAHVAGEIEAIGVWEVGNRADEEGRVSAFRIVVDGIEPKAESTEKPR